MIDIMNTRSRVMVLNLRCHPGLRRYTPLEVWFGVKGIRSRGTLVDLRDSLVPCIAWLRTVGHLVRN